jgi:hypothetical protein
MPFSVAGCLLLATPKLRFLRSHKGARNTDLLFAPPGRAFTVEVR